MTAQTVAGAPTRIDLRHLRPVSQQTQQFPATRIGEVDGLGAVPVITVAQLLLRRYYVTIRADGLYGPQTRAAVLAFQSRAQRRRTGDLTASDWADLVSRSEVTIGSRGNAVRAVQTLLNDRLGCTEQLIEDGVLGTGTLMRIQDVQRAARLRVTRTVDVATFGALLRS